MYISAQRVKSLTGPSAGHQGINTFYYVHGPRSWAGRPPDDLMPEKNPGVLADSLVELSPPQGNRVRSFLDIVAPDGTLLSPIVHAAGESRVVPALPVEWVRGAIWCRFGAEQALAGEWQHERHRLLARIILLWKRQLPV